jgi:flagellar basal body-associated protein FliL
MKKVLDFFKGTIITIWVFIAIVTTAYLIFFNDFSVSQIGDLSIFIVDSDRLEPEFKKNDIVITKKVPENSYKEGDFAFFYIDNAKDRIYINYGEITKIDVNDHAEDAFHFGENDAVSYSYLMGPVNGTIIYHKVGAILRIFASRIGFLFLIILPTLFALVYEIFSIVEEAKEEAKAEAKLEREQEKNEG